MKEKLAFSCARVASVRLMSTCSLVVLARDALAWRSRRECASAWRGFVLRSVRGGGGGVEGDKLAIYL